MCVPCHGYVMVRGGFGDLHSDDTGSFEKTNGAVDNPPPDGQEIHGICRQNQCTTGSFHYSSKNLSVALGRRFDIFAFGALGLELEILGTYAKLKDPTRTLTNQLGNMIAIPMPDMYGVIAKRIREPGNPNPATLLNPRFLYLKNQYVAGAQVNVYWEQYLLDWLSAGIGGGIGGAYVSTRFSTLEFYVRGIGAGAPFATPATNHSKYVHSGSLLYNFSLFVRAEKFETLFEVGYRHIGLHQMWNKCYGYTIPKLANMHSDQVYIGVGRTF
ncbi:MAG: hypothetical protein MJ218_00665 [Opitutales bacterium]|nr:hypothetical protein [Opitutales bacterium]